MMTTIQDENFPYFIIAPDYRDSSAGVQVMHRLCHLLNESGRRAWMVNCKVNPEWNTPAVTGKELRDYRLRGGLFIAVYPEVVSGNPHQAPVVVRYMLNRESAINGNTLQDKVGDLFYWYRPEFAAKHHHANILNIECYDLDLFCDEQRKRNRDVLYLNRVPESAVDFASLPADIQILSMRNPLSLPQLAEILKTTRTLYTYESSGTGLLAVLCGCPVVALTARGYEQHAVTPATINDLNGLGYCWDDKPGTLERVRSNIGEMHDVLLERRKQTASQLDHLVSSSQQAAREFQQTVWEGRLENWLVNRSLTPALKSKLQFTQMPRLLITIFDDAEHPDRLSLTLDTLAERPAYVAVVIVTSRQDAARQGVEVVALTHWRGWLARQVAEDTFDWLQCIPAGGFYSADCWPGLAHFLASQTQVQAVYADELWLDANGEPVPHLKPQWDWDLFSNAPEIYLKRCLLARSAFAQWLDTAHLTQALDVSVLQQLYLHAGVMAIRHYPDLICILPQPQVHTEESDEAAQALNALTIQRGYPTASVEVQPGLPMRVVYHHRAQPLVSLILLAGNKLAALERAITSLLQYNAWANTELLVINHQHSDSTINTWLEGLASIDPARIRVINLTVGWQPVILRNRASQHAKGDFLCFIEPHLIFFSDNWLSALMNHAQRQEVAVVGPKLIHTEQHILSAGIIGGYRGLAGHIGKGERWDSMIAAGFLQSDRYSRLLDGQCLVVRQTCWHEMKGLDESYGDIALAEIDFFLKVAQAGYLSIWTPHSVVATDADARGFNPSSVEASHLQQQWGRSLFCDPGYHPSHSLYGEPFTVDESVKQMWPAFAQANIPRVVWVQGDNGMPASAYLGEILSAMAQQQQIALLTYDALAPWVLVRLQPDMLIISAEVGERQLGHLKSITSMTGCQTYCLPEAGINQQTVQGLLHADWLAGWLVCNEELKLWLQKRKQTVYSLPSLVVMPKLQLEVAPRGTKLRVLCDTLQLSDADKRFFAPVINETAGFIDWVIRGDVPAGWFAGVSEIHRTHSVLVNADDIISLQVNLAVLFRLNNDENRFKDNLPLLHYQAASLPVLCSEHIALAHGGSVTAVRNKDNVWITRLREWLQNVEPAVVSPVTRENQLTTNTLATFWQQAGVDLQ